MKKCSKKIQIKSNGICKQTFLETVITAQCYELQRSSFMLRVLQQQNNKKKPYKTISFYLNQTGKIENLGSVAGMCWPLG